MARISRSQLCTAILCGLALVPSAGVIGCRRPPAANSSPAPKIAPTYDKATGRLTRIAYDRNHDGKSDAWLDMQGARVVSAELDEDFDGVIDRKEFYGGQPVATPTQTSVTGALPPRAELNRAEQSTRGDGKMNRFETYEAGRLVHVEEDTNGDGRIDKWETWSGGVLQMMALDTKGTGHPDRRLVYPADGSNPQMEVDATGKGTFTPIAAGR
jgi:hypothetical protein